MFFYMQKTAYCSDCNMTLTEFGWKCERAALRTCQLHFGDNIIVCVFMTLVTRMIRLL